MSIKSNAIFLKISFLKAQIIRLYKDTGVVHQLTEVMGLMPIYSLLAGDTR